MRKKGVKTPFIARPEDKMLPGWLKGIS